MFGRDSRGELAPAAVLNLSFGRGARRPFGWRLLSIGAALAAAVYLLGSSNSILGESYVDHSSGASSSASSERRVRPGFSGNWRKKVKPRVRAGLNVESETPQVLGEEIETRARADSVKLTAAHGPSALEATGLDASDTFQIVAPSTTSLPPAASRPPSASGSPLAPTPTPNGAAASASAQGPLDRFIYYPSQQTGDDGCRPFSGMVLVMTHTHLQARPAEQRAFCGGLWKAQAARGYRPIIIGDTVQLAAVLGTEPPRYDHLVKVSSHSAFLSQVISQRALPNDTLVVYHDALDVLAMGPAQEMFECVSRAFCARKMDVASGVYFLGEKSLWPPSCRYVDEGRSWCNDHPELLPLPVYPDLTEPGGHFDYRFINSGMVSRRGVVAGLWQSSLWQSNRDFNLAHR